MLSHALHGIVKPTQQAQLPLHQLQRLQSLQRHYPMTRTVSVAIQRGHWEPWCMTVSNGFSQGNKHESKHKSGKRCWNWRNQSVKTLTMPPLKVHHHRGEPRGRDCTDNYKNHSTAWHSQFFLKQRPVGRFSEVMAHGPAEKLSPHGKIITNRKGTSRRQRARNVDLKSCEF